VEEAGVNGNNSTHNRFFSGKIIPRALFYLLISAAIVILGAILYANLSSQAVQDIVRYTPDTIQVDPSQFSDDITAKQAQKQALQLFDRDTTSLYAPKQSTNIDATFGGRINLKFIKVYGPASYYMTIYALTAGNNWSEVSGLTRINLSKAAQAWNKYKATSGQTSASFRVKLEPISGAAASGAPELEFWADGTRMNIKDGGALSAALDENGFSSFGKKFIASPVSADVTVTRDGENTTISNAVFYINVSGQASDYSRAWLIYDLKGLGSWIGAQHTINNMGAVTAWPVAGTDDWANQVEPIDPDLLVSGNNTVTFTLPAGSAAGYSVRNLALVVETDNGFNQFSGIESGDNGQANMLDGDSSTSWNPAGANSSAIFDLYRPIQAESIGVQTGNNPDGIFTISGLNNDVWEQTAASVKMSSLQNGWNTIAAGAGKTYDKVGFDVTGTAGSSGGIAEAAVCGSGIGAARSLGITINYPDNGQYYGRAAYIKGYLPVPDNGSGVAQVLVGPVAATVADGVFEGIVSKEDMGLDGDADSSAWSVDVAAIYPDGVKIVKTVKLYSLLAAVAASGEATAYGIGTGTGRATKISKNGIELEFDADSNTANVQVLPLGANDLPPLELGMVNVTGNHKGFRFLPHHAKFKNKIRMKLPYDKTLIPKHQTEKDVHTYYFNDIVNRWLPVEFEQLDSTNGKIVSLTDHFTDFINATITVPDHEQTQSFNPNSIKELKAALPGAGITMIEPPEANNQGDAALNFRIETPPGRKGLQPDVVITYNSGGGDGLLGIGWDLPVNSVQCDTKFGVPQYDAGQYDTGDGHEIRAPLETESYLLEGEPLIPNARRAAFETRGTGDKRFYSQIEGKFLRIVRKKYDPTKNTGDRSKITPDNYYWEVTDKNGTKKTYGYDFDQDDPNNSRLCVPANGNTYIWALSRVQDKNGNHMDYYYKFNGDAPDPVDHSNIRLDHIAYNSIYRIDFSYTDRANFRSDGRGGFLRKYTKLLTQITENNTSEGNIIRSYVFEYDGGKFGHERLEHIRQYGKGGVEIPGAAHDFTYYADIDYSDLHASLPLFGGHSGWGGLLENNTDTENISIFGIPPEIINLGASSIESAITKGSGWGITIPLYAKIDFPWPLQFLNGRIDAGYKYNENTTYNHGVYNLMDVDGDGRPDLVYTPNGTDFYWRKNDGNGEYIVPTDNVVHYITAISYERQKSVINGLFFMDSGSPSVDSKATKFMVDANSDGIPDLSDNCMVRFGVRTGTDADPGITYQDNADNTEFPVNPGTKPDFGLYDIKTNLEYLDDLTNNPLVDTIKKWEAPYTGTVHITGDASLSHVNEDLREATSYKPRFDGVWATIQYNGLNNGVTEYPPNNTELWRQRINRVDGYPNQIDYSAHTPTFSGGQDIHVHAGDRLYFRLQSVYDGKYDNVNWDPQVTYMDLGTDWTDSNLLSQEHYGSSSDFTIAGMREAYVNMQFTGEVHLAGDIIKTGVTTDDIKLRIYLVKKSTGEKLDINQADTHDDQVLPWCSSDGHLSMGADGTDTDGNQYKKINVDQGDQLIVYADIDSNIDLHKITWHPYIRYASANPDENPPSDILSLKGYIQYDMMFYPKNIFGTLNKPVVMERPYLKPAPYEKPESCGGVYLRLKGRLTKGATAAPVKIQLILNSTDDDPGVTVDVVELPADVVQENQPFSFIDNTVYIDGSEAGISNPVIKWPLTSIRIKMTAGTLDELKTINWDPQLTYIAKDPQGNWLGSGEQAAVEPPMPYEASLTDETDNYNKTRIRNLHVRPHFEVPAGKGANTDFLVTAKKIGTLMGKGGFHVEAAGSETENTVVEGNVAVADFAPGDALFFECFTKEDVDLTIDKSALPEHMVYYSVPIYVPGVIENFGGVEYFPEGPVFKDPYSDLFAAAYRGWAVAGLDDNPDLTHYYNNSLEVSTAGLDEFSSPYKDTDPARLINEDRLKLLKLEDDKYSFNGNFDQAPMWSYQGMPPVDGLDHPIWKAIDPDTYHIPVELSSTRTHDKYVEKDSTNSGATVSINRESHSEQSTQGTGTLSVGGFGVSGTKVTGWSDSINDYVDLNGDGFPDLVSKTLGKAYFTDPNGGLGANSRNYNDVMGDQIRRTDSDSFDGGLSYSTPFEVVLAKPDPKGKTGSNKGNGAKSGGVGIPMSGTFSIGINRTGGSSQDSVALIDMNGDGIADKVFDRGGHLEVYYGTGYGFDGTAYTWGANDVHKAADINKNESTTYGVGFSVPFDKEVAGIDLSGSLGPGYAFTGSYSKQSYIDVNGDGLPDMIAGDGRVWFNTGSGFLEGIDGEGFDEEGHKFGDDESSHADNTSWSISASGGKKWGLGKYIEAGIGVSGYWCPEDSSQSINRQKQMLIDMNGDGLPDETWSGDNSNDFHVAYNNTGRTNLLKTITRPMGAVITLDYSRTANSFDNPHPKWNLASVNVAACPADSPAKPSLPDRHVDITYTGGKYDKFYREFRGYANVHEEQILNPGQKRLVDKAYITDDLFRKGLAASETVHSDTATHYIKNYAYTDDPIVNVVDGSYDHYLLNRSYFPKLTGITEEFFENGNHIDRSEVYEYDRCGNITTYTETGSESDVVNAYVNYKDNSVPFLPSGGLDPILDLGPINLAQDITVRIGGVEKRNRHADYDSHGNPVTIKQYYGTGGSDYAQTDIVYDDANGYPGNMATLILPEINSAGSGHKGELDYIYDDLTHSYVVKVTDKIGYSSTMAPDYDFGKPQSTADINGNIFNYLYDYAGRLTWVQGPNETGDQYAVTYDYHPEAAVPYAVSKNRDMAREAEHPGDDIDVVTFTDGLGRVIQTKKDAAIPDAGYGSANTTINDKLVVSGRVFYDAGGRVIDQYYPSIDEKSSETTFDAVMDDNEGIDPTHYTYDEFDRPTGIAFPDGTSQSFTYMWASSPTPNRLVTEAKNKDASGSDMPNIKRTFKDSKQQIRKVEEEDHNASLVLTTAYDYNALGEMTQVTDHNANITYISYDLMGRRTVISNPDTGAITWVYDAASNVTEKHTPNLVSASPSYIAYTYDDNNRLTWVSYPVNTQNNVTYTYGGTGETGDLNGNVAGRVKSVSFGGGQTRQMTYDGLGNVASETYSKTFGKQDTYTTQYTWDDLGRMLSMIYPDGTRLAYTYDSGGLVNSVADVTSGDPVYYVNSLIYDKFGQRFDIQYGNGIGSRYSYDPATRRVGEIYTSTRGTNGALLSPVQDLQYSYDAVGNVTAVTNNMNISFDGKPESVNRNFNYDGFYRLTSSDGHLHDNSLVVGQGTPVVTTDEVRNYTVTTTFDNIHNLTGKTQVVNNVDPYTGQQTGSGPSYDFTGSNAYQYGSGKPHFASSVNGINYNNDADGNKTGYTISQYEYVSMDWDEEDRMTGWGLHNPGGGWNESYRYNEAGERTVKLYTYSPNSTETMYPNQFYTAIYCTNLGTGGAYGPSTKNIYIGNERAASVVRVNWTQGEGYYLYTYYYHSDHLGSTTYLSDVNGAIREHMEYTPWGESWVQQNNAEYPRNYLFTGKELDSTTGLYYFGARYYDPQTSMWMSPDPAIPEYLDSMAGNGGIYNSRNLAVYSYAQHNPVRYTDPDGRMTGGELALSQGAMVSLGAIFASNPEIWPVVIGAAGVGLVVGGAYITYNYLKEHQAAGEGNKNQSAGADTAGDNTNAQAQPQVQPPNSGNDNNKKKKEDKIEQKDEQDNEDTYKEKTRDKVRDKLPKDKQTGGEDPNLGKGNVKPPKGTKEYDRWKAEQDKTKGGAGMGGAGNVNDIQ
jgi:RHS repeat-associated protein